MNRDVGDGGKEDKYETADFMKSEGFQDVRQVMADLSPNIFLYSPFSIE